MRVIILVIMLFASKVSAQPYTAKQDQYNRFKTAIVNGGFENGTSQWSASGGSFTVSTTSGQFRSGARGGAFDASASSQTLTSAANTVAPGNNQVSCYFKTTATDYTFEAFDGTNVITSQVIPASSEFQKIVLNVATGTASALRARISSGSNAAAIYVDDCFSGEADNIGSVSQASLYGSALHPSTLNCAWSSTATSYGAFSTDSDCPTPTLVGNALAPSTKVPGIRFASLPPGDYLVIAKASFRDTTLDSNGCAFAISDGTSRYGQTQVYAGASMGGLISTIATRIKYTTAQGDTTFQVHSRSDNASNTCTLGLGDTASEQTLEFLVYRYPLESEQVLTPNVLPWRVDANIGGANPSLGLSSVSSYTGITDAGLDMVKNTGSIDVQIPCSSTNSSSGLTCSSGDESIGVVFNIPKAGAALACFNFTHAATLDSVGDGVNTAFQIVETANNAQTILQEGKTRITAYNYSDATSSMSQQKPVRLCGTFNFASAGQKTLRLMYEQSVQATPTQSLLTADRDSGAGQRDIHVEVYPLDQQIPAPLLVGNVLSNSSVTERVERVKVTYSAGVPSITSQSGSWVTSLTDNGTGDLQYNISSSLWSSAPSCTCSSGGGGLQRMFCDVRTTSTSAVNVIFYNAAASALADPTNPTDLICMGPRP